MKNIKKQQKQLSRKLSFIQEKPYFLRICKRNNVVSFVVAVLFFAVSFVPTVYSADIIPPTLITEAWISDNTVGNYIADGGVVSLDDINEAGEFITIYFSASDGSGLYNHKAQVKMGAGPWITLVDCWDADMDEYCGFMGDIRITDLKSDSTGDIPQLQIGPFNDGDVISYRSSATDTVLPVGNTGWSFEKSFTVKAETWIRSFNEGNDTFEAYDVLQVSDGYIIAGSRKISVIAQRRFSLTKLDNKGFVIWSRDYGDAVDNGFTLARSIKQTSDLGYVIAGHTTAYGSEEDLTVLKVDSVGNKEWYKVIAGVNRDYAVEILQLPSPGLGYVIAGHTSSYDVNENVHDAMIIKLDSNGNKIWEKTTNTASDAYIFDFQKTSNN
ncbi:MAG: hypothetical protein KAS78_00845, partial [Candidatus Pacebacteria bacterium]|nr:hypothetical protein [Candidatus Paceibacterota bacterium]